MQFAQKDVSLERGASRGVRDLLRAADVGEYADAVGASWDASFVQLSAGHLDAGIEFLAGDRFVLYRERWSQRLHTVGPFKRISGFRPRLISRCAGWIFANAR